MSYVGCFRGMFVQVDAQAPPTVPDHAAQHHIPDVRVSARLRRLVLPQRSHLLHLQDRGVHSIQLRVSTYYPYCYVPNLT